jgi:hypothetical protein
VGESFGISGMLGKNPNSILKATITYRRLDIKDTLLTAQKPDNTLINRIEYSLSVLKGAITSSTFYEVGSGLESKKDYVFVEVTPGQGAWSWIDQNANGIKEVVEYVPAIFQDTAKYIRVYIPTNEFIKVYTPRSFRKPSTSIRVCFGPIKKVL